MMPFESQRAYIVSELGEEDSFTVRVETDSQCPMATVDDDGEQVPCEKPVSAWNFSSDLEFPICLTAVCSAHRNALGDALGADLAQSIEWSRL